jgi:hypothetical protein
MAQRTEEGEHGRGCDGRVGGNQARCRAARLADDAVHARPDLQ